MKTALLVTALLVATCTLSRAEVPEPVLAQIRADLKAGMHAKDSSVPDDKIAQEIAAFEKETASAIPSKNPSCSLRWSFI